ncbi:2-amino-4-hydroxy-6-hydroxymethyldihydropteridine diphosphokinase [Novosphingobium umbonatum]|uniref:2-amino-4-hydroxy-6-hydroxymethyldihydropteridine pyrophosphokinase n=1 Tax=Novosphingobium umbonatum TaxID=1908524 RepID=A0A3S2UWQ0_9SPHN|nr:2-amino-4-hydroxy-6-hydroxymethyldihydropteridine diphosphokinase [Novosphingobium umbonatum]RVU07013.1 2-amino-4-hydroxy-6-hydroxymethyldihydropteridine diphosphokinase [Novosphingobium umbonatum]
MRRRTSDLYLIALGSNVRHHRHGAPQRVLMAGVAALETAGVRVERVAPVIRSAPIGPSLRQYANGAALVRSDMSPPAMLALLKRIERAFGRKRAQRWASRVLDLDIVLWGGGLWRAPDLQVPHRLFRQRSFVLGPASAIAPNWRDPVTGFTLRQLNRRLTRAQTAPRDPQPDA